MPKKASGSWITVKKEENSDEEEKKQQPPPVKKIDNSWLTKQNTEELDNKLPPAPVPKKTMAPTKSEPSDGGSNAFKNQLEMMLARGPRGAAVTMKPTATKATDWGPGVSKMKPISEEEM